MAFACSSSVSQTQIHGHQSFLKYSGNVHALSSVKAIQNYRNHSGLLTGCSSSIMDKVQLRSRHVVASLGENVQGNSTESMEENSGPLDKGTQEIGSEAPFISSSSPFVGAKISSRIAARTAEASNNKTTGSVATPVDSLSSEVTSSTGVAEKAEGSTKKTIVSVATPVDSSSSKITSSKGSLSFGAPSFAAGEKLKNSRPSVFLEPSTGSKEPASKNLLNALRQADLQGKTTKFGQPVVPTNLFDEPRKLPTDEKKFDFTLNMGQLVLIFSFLTIISIMFGTAYIVWKVGGIHFNEY